MYYNLKAYLETMQHKILSLLGILLIVLGTNQCKCGSQPVYDTINLDLQWEEGPQPIDVAGLDLNTASGLSGVVPSENATYFINATDGKTYKFMQEGGALKCQASGNLALFQLDKAFVFVAGSMQKQNLYFGTLNGGKLSIYQLEEGAWKEVINQSIGTFFPGSTIQEDKFVVACSLQLDGQQQGCIMFMHKQVVKTELGCLLYDPDKNSLTKVEVNPSYSVTKDTHLIGLLEVKPGKVLLGNHYTDPGHKDNYHIFQIEAKTLRLLSNSFKNDEFTIPIVGTTSKWQFFSLLDSNADPSIAIPIFTVYSNERYFLRLSTKSDLQNLTIPPDIATKPNLPTFCGGKLYLITTRPKPATDEQQNSGSEEEVIYYSPQLVKDTRETKKLTKNQAPTT